MQCDFPIVASINIGLYIYLEPIASKKSLLYCMTQPSIIYLISIVLSIIINTPNHPNLYFWKKLDTALVLLRAVCFLRIHFRVLCM